MPRSWHAPRPLFSCPYILQHQVARCTIPSHTTFFLSLSLHVPEPTMATPGFPPPFGAPSGPNTATPSEADIHPGAGFMSRYLEGTRYIVTLSPDQLPTLTPQECQSLSPRESVLIPLLCSTIHALNAIGLQVDELHTRMQDRSSQIANSLIVPEIRDLRNSVSHPSRCVAPPVLRPTPSSSVPPPPSNPTSGSPNRPSSPPPPAILQDSPPQPAVPPPTLSYADVIHGGTSEFDQVIAANAASRRGKGKGKKSPLLPLPPKLRPSLRLPHSRAPLSLPVLQEDSMPPGTRLPPTPNATLSASVGPTWPPLF